MKKFLTVAILAASMGMGSAQAFFNGGDDSHDDNRSYDNSSHDNSSHDNSTHNAGGAGGQGGSGLGVGVGVGVGQGGDASSSSRSGSAVLGSGNSRNNNEIENSGNSRSSSSADNRNANLQGQQQGQVGINKSRNDNTNVGIQGQVGINKNGSVTGGNNSVSGGNVYIGGEGEGQGGSTLSPTASSNQSQSQDGNSLNNGSITINTGLDPQAARDLAAPDDNSVNVTTTDNSVYEAQKRNPVSSAWSAPLVTSNDTCMGSTSAGGQGITLGLSFATTWRDKDCVIRKDARFLHNAQHQTVALGLMCEKASVRRAVARAGSVAERLACGLNADGSEPVAANTDTALVDGEGNAVMVGE